MNKSESNQVKKAIAEELAKTRTLIDDLKELTKPIRPENAIGRISRMDAINNKSVNEAALRKAVEKESKLQVALAKVDEDDFGICIKCKQIIPIGRIMLMPQSNKCVNCA